MLTVYEDAIYMQSRTIGPRSWRSYDGLCDGVVRDGSSCLSHQQV